jgi:glycerate 2-kinase
VKAPADLRSFLRGLFDAAVAAAGPARNLPGHLPVPPQGRTVVVGAGKAAASMAAAFEREWHGALVVSGPTRTNVNDFRAIFVSSSSGHCE